MSYAWALSDLARYDEAIEQVDLALATNPLRSWALASKIGFLRFANRYRDARAVAEDALRLRPNDPRLRVSYAWALSDLARYDEAIEEVDLALATNPRRSWALASKIGFLRFANRYKDARAVAEDALRLRPNDPQLRVSYAWALFDLDRYDEAIEEVDLALATNPRHSWALASKIDLLRNAGRHEGARAVAEDALRLRPNDPQLRVSYAWALSDLDLDDEAIEEVDLALATNPRHSRALASKIGFLRFIYRFEDAHAVAEDALRVRPNDPQIRVSKAWALSDLGRYDEAIEQVRLALITDPRHAVALASKIHLLRNANRYEDARTVATNALQLRSNDPQLRVAYAWALSADGRDDEAIEQVDLALATNPLRSWALASKIDFLRFANRYKDARAVAEDALRLRPNDPRLRVSYAWVLSDLDLDDEAIEQVDLALAANPRHSWALASRIDFLRFAYRYQEALVAAKHAAAKKPLGLNVQLSHAWLLFDLGNEAGAISQVEDVLAAAPNHGRALRSRIEFLREQGTLALACEAVEDALRRRPSDERLHIQDAFLKIAQGHVVGAVSAAVRAKKLAPQSPAVQEACVIVYSWAQDWEAAEDAAKQMLRTRPMSPKAIALRSQQLAQQRRPGEALALLLPALDTLPANGPLLVSAAEALRQQGRSEEARRRLTATLKIRPNDQELMRELAATYVSLRRHIEAKRILGKTLSMTTSKRERASAERALGTVSFAQGYFEDAASHFRIAVELTTDAIFGRQELAWSLTRQASTRAWDEAWDICEEIRGLVDSPAAAHCQGVIAFRRGWPAAAESYLREAESKTQYYSCLTDLGALLAQLHRYSEAEEILRKSIDRDWYDWRAHLELGNVFRLLGDERRDESVAQFRHAAAIAPQSPDALINLAQGLVAIDQVDEAEATLRSGISGFDHNGAWQAELALARLLNLRAGKEQNALLYAEAYEHAQRAIRWAPNAAAEPHFVAGISYQGLGALTADIRSARYRSVAVAHLSACIERDPGHASANHTLNILRQEERAATPIALGGYIVSSISVALLLLTWLAFYGFNKGTTALLSIMTPMLIGLATVSMLLPNLAKLKMPGFQADLRQGTTAGPTGPMGIASFSPNHVTGTLGPLGDDLYREPAPRLAGVSESSLLTGSIRRPLVAPLYGKGSMVPFLGFGAGH